MEAPLKVNEKDLVEPLLDRLLSEDLELELTSGDSRLTQQGLENASIHVSIVLMIVYASFTVATIIGKPEIRYSIAHFA